MRNDYAAKAWLNRERQIDRDTQRAVQGIANALAISLVTLSMLALVVELGFRALERDDYPVEISR